MVLCYGLNNRNVLSCKFGGCKSKIEGVTIYLPPQLPGSLVTKSKLQQDMVRQNFVKLPSQMPACWNHEGYDSKTWSSKQTNAEKHSTINKTTLEKDMTSLKVKVFTLSYPF